jgi:hypothetical protein
MATVAGESRCGNVRLQVEVTQPKNKKQRIESAIAQSEAVSVKTASSGKRKVGVLQISWILSDHYFIGS